MKLGSKLKELRAAAGLTSGELAERAGLTVVGLSNHEAGRSVPTLASLTRLASALGVGIGEFDGCVLPQDGRCRRWKRVPA